MLIQKATDKIACWTASGVWIGMHLGRAVEIVCHAGNIRRPNYFSSAQPGQLPQLNGPEVYGRYYSNVQLASSLFLDDKTIQSLIQSSLGSFIACVYSNILLFQISKKNSWNSQGRITWHAGTHQYCKYAMWFQLQ